jgi:hypothetical protein
MNRTQRHSPQEEFRRKKKKKTGDKHSKRVNRTRPNYTFLSCPMKHDKTEETLKKKM